MVRIWGFLQLFNFYRLSFILAGESRQRVLLYYRTRCTEYIQQMEEKHHQTFSRNRTQCHRNTTQQLLPKNS